MHVKSVGWFQTVRLDKNRTMRWSSSISKLFETFSQPLIIFWLQRVGKKRQNYEINFLQPQFSVFELVCTVVFYCKFLMDILKKQSIFRKKKYFNCIKLNINTA